MAKNINRLFIKSHVDILTKVNTSAADDPYKVQKWDRSIQRPKKIIVSMVFPFLSLRYTIKRHPTISTGAIVKIWHPKLIYHIIYVCGP